MRNCPKVTTLSSNLAPAWTRPDHSGEPSVLYRTDLWQACAWLSRRLPVPCVRWLSGIAAAAYWRIISSRRQVVMQNLAPALDDDLTQANAVARTLFRNFALKLADLWRYEAGCPLDGIVSDLKGWDFLAAAQGRRSGTLLITAHIGNWELGAPLLAARGVKMTVVTLEEPHPGLTELRQSSRARWGIETLVIGRNPFGAVEIIRRLEAGGTVALLVDRPPPSSAVEVTLFGRPFHASIAVAELARATGCVLLPVCLPRVGHAYHAEVLPEISYDRAALGNRGARIELTQRILRVFEPIIRQNLTQWYHFVPIWPRQE